MDSAKTGWQLEVATQDGQQTHYSIICDDFRDREASRIDYRVEIAQNGMGYNSDEASTTKVDKYEAVASILDEIVQARDYGTLTVFTAHTAEPLAARPAKLTH